MLFNLKKIRGILLSLTFFNLEMLLIFLIKKFSEILLSFSIKIRCNFGYI